SHWEATGWTSRVNPYGEVSPWLLWASLRVKVVLAVGMSPDAVSSEYPERSNCSRMRPRLADPLVPMAPGIPGLLNTDSSSERPTFDPVKRDELQSRRSLVMYVSLIG